MTRSSDRTKLLVMTGLLAALACVATMFIQVPSPTNGYMNLGDTVVLLAAYLLGPVYGALAGGVGSCLADLFSGYVMYVPATLIIKAIMGLVAGLIYRAMGKKTASLLVCSVAAEAVMVTGYWLFDAILSTAAGGSLGAALVGSAVGIPSNLVQAAFGIVLSTVLMLALRRNSYMQEQVPAM